MPISISLLHVRTLGVVTLASVLLIGCGFFPEASFSLASESRLPKWFESPLGPDPANTSVTVDYYIDSSGRTAKFTLRDSNGHVISKVTGKLRGLEPLYLRTRQAGYPKGYPSYEIITVGQATEIIEHRQMEPVFYIQDDPAVLAELQIAANPAVKRDAPQAARPLP
jgi:hypothetical protein